VSFILRKIRKGRWHGSDVLKWIPANDLQADSLVDLATKDNQLSIYIVVSDRSNLDRVIAALSANCDFISNFDFALLNKEVFDAINIKVANVRGVTPDEEVNAVHRDLVELSAGQILELAKAISTTAERRRLTNKQVLSVLATAVASGHIDRDKLKLKADELAKIDNELQARMEKPGN
jgi:hypothetical protein